MKNTSEVNGITINLTSKLLERISSLYLNEKFSDIVVKVGNEQLYAHRVILAVRSKYFENLLYNKNKPISESEITLSDDSSQISLHAHKMILRYIYTGTIIIVVSNTELTAELLCLAHKYLLDDLKLAIIKKLKTMDDLKNVICSLLYNKQFYSSDSLKDFCKNLII